MEVVVEVVIEEEEEEEEVVVVEVVEVVVVIEVKVEVAEALERKVDGDDSTKSGARGVTWT